MNPDDEVKADEYDRAVTQLKSKRSSLHERILEELSTLDQIPDAFLVRNKINEAIKILKKSDLTGEEADLISKALYSLYILNIGNMEMMDILFQQWEFLYLTKTDIKINNSAVIEYIISQNRSK